MFYTEADIAAVCSAVLSTTEIVNPKRDVIRAATFDFNSRRLWYGLGSQNVVLAFLAASIAFLFQYRFTKGK